MKVYIYFYLFILGICSVDTYYNYAVLYNSELFLVPTWYKLADIIAFVGCVLGLFGTVFSLLLRFDTSNEGQGARKELVDAFRSGIPSLFFFPFWAMAAANVQFGDIGDAFHCVVFAVLFSAFQSSIREGNKELVISMAKRGTKSETSTEAAHLE